MRDYMLRADGASSPSRALAARLDLSPRFLEILWGRGLRSAGDIDDFLNARLGGLVNPERWPQIPEAADFLVERLLSGGRLAIWGDYDVDGITSTALVLDVLSFHGFEADWHIPHRNDEGYGVNVDGVETLAARGVTMLLTVDSGVSDVDAIARARALGMDVVVSDHHLPPRVLPPANFFVNPRMPASDRVPCPHLAGVGVAFYLMAAVNKRLARHTGRSFKMDDVLDLVALGTIADVMSLTGQNRLLVRGGLSRLESPARPGLAALKAVAGIPAGAPVTATQVAFKIAPRINAAGRLKHADVALLLLRSRSYEEARTVAEQLDQINRLRREIEKGIVVQAIDQAREQRANGSTGGLVLYGKDWHPGIIGIVATRVVEEFNVPCIIVCDHRDMLKGSGRSIGDFDLYSGLAEIQDHLLSFGGHKQAAGVRILPGHLEAFRKDFSEMTRRHAAEFAKAPLVIEGALGLREAGDADFLSELAEMEPFGTGNEEPVFISNPLRVESRSTFRYKPDSVDLMVRDTVDGHGLHAKGWGLAQAIPASVQGRAIRILYTVRKETDPRFEKVELTIVDWEPVT